MTFKVYVDWQNNNDFTDMIDDISADVMMADWQIGMRRAFQDVADGSTAKLTLDNSSGKYTPENASGPLYGYLLPQRRIKIQNDDGSTVRTMFVGWIEFPTVEWSPAGASTGKVVATLVGQGAKQLLDDLEARLEQYADVTADTVIADVLQQATIPPASPGLWVLGQAGNSELGETTTLGTESDYSDIETGVTVFPTYGDKETRSGWDVIKEVTIAERGRFYFDRDGKAIFWNRHHLLTDTVNDGTVTTNNTYKPRKLAYAYGEHLANVIKVDANPRQTGNSETLWSLDRTVSIPPNDTAAFDIRLRKSNGQFAGASNLTGSPTFSQGTAVVTVQAEGGKAAVTATNSATEQAVMTGLTVSGAPTIQQNAMSVTVEDATSIGAYGKHGLNISLGPVEDYDDIDNIARFEINRRKDPTGNISKIDYTNKDDGALNLHQLLWTIGTRINVTASEISHNSDYFIIGEKHVVKPGSLHTTTFYLEPASKSLYWNLGVADFSELGETTLLAY